MKNQRMFLLIFHFLSLFCAAFSNGDPTLGVALESLDILQVDDFREFIRSPDVLLIYFFKTESSKVKAFYRQFDKASEHLHAYSVHCAIVDCSVETTEEYCKRDRVEHSVFTFKEGFEYAELELDAMFDVSAIVSNTMQIVLLHEVPILQNQIELRQLIERFVGKKDIIVSYHEAIGTYAHRVVMEMAYAYRNNYKFAMCTDKKVVKDFGVADDVNVAIWLLQCKQTKPSESKCPVTKYVDALDLPSLLRFIRSLSLPRVHAVPDNSDPIPYEEHNMHMLLMFYDTASRTQVIKLAHKMADEFHGIIGVVTIDTSRVSSSVKDKYHFIGNVPAVGLKLRDDDKPDYHSDLSSVETVQEFINGKLTTYVFNNLIYKQKPNAYDEPDDVSAMDELVMMEHQDDQIAHSVYAMRHVLFDFQYVTVLNRTSFQNVIAHAQHLMLLFHLKFDASSQAVLRTYEYVSSIINETGQSCQLAMIDCHQWTDICDMVNVSAYPVIRLYQNGQYLSTYHGHLEMNDLVAAAVMLAHSALITLDTTEAATDFIEGTFPEHVHSIGSNTSYLALISKKSDVDVFREIAAKYSMKFVFGLSTGETTKHIASQLSVPVPSVVVIRRNDPIKDRVSYTGDMLQDKLEKFIIQQSLPVVPELTSRTFPSVHKSGKPIVILFRLHTDIDSLSMLAEIAQGNRFETLSICWMNVESPDNLAAEILQEYSKDAPVPALALVQHSKGFVSMYQDSEWDVNHIEKWMQHVIDGKLTADYTMPRPDWQPLHAGYDYLSLMAEGLSGKSEPSEELEEANEYGLGHRDDSEFESEEDVMADDDLDDDDSRMGRETFPNPRLYGRHTRPKRESDDHVSHMLNTHDPGEL